MLPGLPNLKIIAIAVAAVALVGFVQQLRVWSLQADLREAQQQVRTVTAQREELAAANRQCTADVKRQNAAVQQWKDEAERRAEAGRKAMVAAARQSASIELENERLRGLAMSVPGDACASADALLREAIEKRKAAP